MKVREAVGHLVDLQIVALVSPPISGPDGGPNRAALTRGDRRRRRRRRRRARTSNPTRAPPWSHVLEVAAAAGLARRPAHRRDARRRRAAPGRPGRPVVAPASRTGVTASHCVSLGMQPPRCRSRSPTAVAAAGIAVVTLPQTNLFLQGRGLDHGTARAASPPSGPCSTPASTSPPAPTTCRTRSTSSAGPIRWRPAR